MSTDHYIQRRNELNRCARQFLSHLLAGGPQSYTTVCQRAREAGVSLSCLLTAKRSLRVKSRTRDGYAVWNLPAVA
jgi:hypothetical protein